MPTALIFSDGILSMHASGKGWRAREIICFAPPAVQYFLSGGWGVGFPTSLCPRWRHHWYVCQGVGKASVRDGLFSSIPTDRMSAALYFQRCRTWYTRQRVGETSARDPLFPLRPFSFLGAGGGGWWLFAAPYPRWWLFWYACKQVGRASARDSFVLESSPLTMYELDRKQKEGVLAAV